MSVPVFLDLDDVLLIHERGHERQRARAEPVAGPLHARLLFHLARHRPGPTEPRP